MLARHHYDPDGLSPFVRTRFEAVRDALAEALQPGDLALDWRWHGPALQEVVLEDQGRRLVLKLRADADGPWRLGHRTLHVQRETDGVDALEVDAFRDWLGALGPRLTTDPPDPVPLETALAAFGPLHRVHDHMYRALESSTRGKTGILRLGFRCSQDCAFCWQDRSWPAPPDALYPIWIDEMAAQGAQALTITGGEPTLHPDLPALAARARDHEMPVLLQTNAIRLRKPAYAAALKEAGVRSLLVSLHAADSGLSDEMTRAPGTHQRTLEGIDAALDAGFEVALNGLVERTNLEDLPHLARLILDRFVAGHPDNPPVMVNLSQPADYFDPSLEQARIAPLDQVRPKLIETVRILREAGMLVVTTGQCGFPVCAFHGAMELARISPVEHRDDWHLASRAQLPEPCGDCAAQAVCVGRRSTYRARFGARGLIPLTEEEVARAMSSTATTMQPRGI